MERNMTKVAFYIMNNKGYVTLRGFVERYGADAIAYIVTSQDKALRKDYHDEILTLAKKFKIKIFDRSENLGDLEDDQNIYKFAIGWRWIISKEERLVVFHDSILPKYRGFAPLVNSLINKEKEIGVTALIASNDYDEGDIISQKKLKIDYPIKINKAIKVITPLYLELVDEVYKKIKSNEKIRLKKQDHDSATYSLWLNSDDYFIDWSWDAERIKRFVDSVGYPYDNAKAKLELKTIKFVDVEIVDDVFIENRARHLGKIIFKRDGHPVVVCSSGLLKLIDIRDCEDKTININFRSKFI
tara:strand:+ start:1835 stop:2734 length:900 start_codon:yes stop_codon:yes gene_type:complete